MMTIRDLLLRVQRDAAYADLVIADPDTAAVGYDLSPEEVDSLRRRDVSLYRYLVPAHRWQERGAGDQSPPWEQQPPVEWRPIDLPLFDKLNFQDPLIDLDLFNDLPLNDWPISPKRMLLGEPERVARVEEIGTLGGHERRAKIEELLEYVR